ncbi:MAG: hypothetical protein ACTIJ6_01845 [Leucobacter sp.]
MQSSLTRLRSAGIAAIAAVGLAAASIVGFASAAQADHIPQEALEGEVGSWLGWQDGGEPITYSECAVNLPTVSGVMNYADGIPSGADVAPFLNSLSLSLASGSGLLGVILDSFDATTGTAYSIQLFLDVSAGVTSLGPDTVINTVYDDRGTLNSGATLQEVVDSLDDTFSLDTVEFSTWDELGAELQWIAYGSETYWFGSDADWFLNDPTCSGVVVEEEVVPAPVAQPMAPKKIETAARG